MLFLTVMEDVLMLELVLMLCIGINGKVLQLINAFFHQNIKQRVIVHGTLSELSTVTSSIQQCSLLGPILLLYMSMIYLTVYKTILAFF